MSTFLSTVGELPLHPLIVHAAVVLVPLTALLTIGSLLIPALRRRLLGFTVVLGLAGAVSAFIATQSGEALSAVRDVDEAHEQWGELLQVSSLVLAVVLVIWWFVVRVNAHRLPGAGAEETRAEHSDQGQTTTEAPPAKPRQGVLGAVLGTIAAVVGAVAFVLAILAGHSGAQSVWSGVVATQEQQTGGATDTNTQTSQATDGSTEQAGDSSATNATGNSDSAQTYTLAEVEQHAVAEDCWVAIDGGVYDLTDWVSQHPGGEGEIIRICGSDASEAFNTQHSGNEEAESALSSYRIGDLG